MVMMMVTIVVMVMVMWILFILNKYIHINFFIGATIRSHCEDTAVHLVFNPFSQLVPQLELYSQLQLSLWSDPIAFIVPKPT